MVLEFLPAIINIPVQTDWTKAVSELDLPKASSHSIYNTDMLKQKPNPNPLETKAAISINHLFLGRLFVSVFSSA